MFSEYFFNSLIKILVLYYEQNFSHVSSIQDFNTYVLFIYCYIAHFGETSDFVLAYKVLLTKSSFSTAYICQNKTMIINVYYFEIVKQEKIKFITWFHKQLADTV